MAGLTREQRAEREAAKLAEESADVQEAVDAAPKAPESQTPVADHINATISDVVVAEVEGGLLVSQEDKRAIVSDKIPLTHVDAGLRNAGFVLK